MTYGRVRVAGNVHNGKGAGVSHLAELVRGDFDIRCHEGPLIRPFGAPSPQGEKGRRGTIGVSIATSGVTFQVGPA